MKNLIGCLAFLLTTILISLPMSAQMPTPPVARLEIQNRKLDSLSQALSRDIRPKLYMNRDSTFAFVAKVDRGQSQMIENLGIKVRERELPGWVSFSTKDTAVVQELMKFIYVEPEQKRTVCLIDDSLFYLQWWFTGNSGLWMGDIREAWRITKGDSTIRVGIIDTGTPLKDGVWTHPDIDSSRCRIGPVFVNAFADSDKTSTDNSGHETHVTGIIGATEGNGIGIKGIDQRCGLHLYKAFNMQGSGDVSDIADAIYRAVRDGCRVINMSFGGSSYSRIEEEAMLYAHTKGVVCVVAAGNGYGEYHSFPAFFGKFTTVPGYREGLDVAGIGSVDDNGKISQFSNRGWFVDLYAPGGSGGYSKGWHWSYDRSSNIFSTLPTYSFVLGDTSAGYTYQRRYGYLAGTSMAAPFVTGVVSLILAANPNLTPIRIKEILIETADRIVTSQGTVLVCNPGAAVRTAKTGILSDVTEKSALPSLLSLYQNYPNPFNPSTTIAFTLAKAGTVSLKIYDVFGREVTTLVQGERPAGKHSVVFKADGLSSGIYFYTLRTSEAVEVKRMILLK